MHAGCKTPVQLTAAAGTMVPLSNVSSTEGCMRGARWLCNAYPQNVNDQPRTWTLFLLCAVLQVTTPSNVVLTLLATRLTAMPRTTRYVGSTHDEALHAVRAVDPAQQIMLPA